MQKTIRTFAIIFAVLNGLFAAVLFILSWQILKGDPSTMSVVKESFRKILSGSTEQEANAIIQSFGYAFLFFGILYIIGIGIEVAIILLTKPSTSKVLGIIIGSISLVFGQFVPGILLIIYSVNKVKNNPPSKVAD